MRDETNAKLKEKEYYIISTYVVGIFIGVAINRFFTLK